MTLHSALTGVELHEPKAIAAAAAGTVYVADGLGSGAFSLPVGNNTTIVNVLADLPAASGGTITLVNDTNYVFAAAINIGTDFITLGTNNLVTSLNFLAPALTYTGVTPMFVGVDVAFLIKDILLTANTAALFDIKETSTGGTKIVDMRSVRATKTTKWGTFEKMQSVLLTNSSCLDCDDGITLVGNVTLVTSLRQFALIGTNTTFIGVDFGTTVQQTVEITDAVFAGGAGSIGIKGAAASANITTNFIANVNNGSFAGVTTPLSGITVDDIRWEFLGNGVIADTMPDALLSLTANASATTLPVGVPTLVAGTWVDERASQFTNTAGGRSTYNGERSILTPIDIDLVIDPASGTNKSIRAFVALDGTEIVASSKAVNISSGDPKQISLHWQIDMATAGFIEVFIENETDSVNATVIDATLRLR